MEQVWRSVRPLLPLILIGLILVTAATVILSFVRTRRGTAPRTAVQTSALDVTLAASILSMLILTLPPSIGAPRTMNLVPFEELRHAVGDFGISQLLGNALMFVPFGFLAPLRWPRIDSAIGILVTATAFSFVTEMLQFVLPTGRQSSVTDVLMNATGALAGYALMVAIRRSVRFAAPCGQGIERLHPRRLEQCRTGCFWIYRRVHHVPSFIVRPGQRQATAQLGLADGW